MQSAELAFRLNSRVPQQAVLDLRKPRSENSPSSPGKVQKKGKPLRNNNDNNRRSRSPQRVAVAPALQVRSHRRRAPRGAQRALQETSTEETEEAQLQQPTPQPPQQQKL